MTDLAAQPAADKATPRLLPCPFCKATSSEMVGELHKFLHANWCPIPATTTNISHVHKDNANAWNTRANSAAVEGLIEAAGAVTCGFCGWQIKSQKPIAGPCESCLPLRAALAAVEQLRKGGESSICHAAIYPDDVCGQPRSAAIHRFGRDAPADTFSLPIGTCEIHGNVVLTDRGECSVCQDAPAETNDAIGIVIVDGVAREAIPCPDGIEGCEVLHLKPLPLEPQAAPIICAQCESNAKWNEAGGYTESAEKCRQYCLNGHKEPAQAVPPEQVNTGTPPDEIWVHPWRETLYYSPTDQPDYISYTRISTASTDVTKESDLWIENDPPTGDSPLVITEIDPSHESRFTKYIPVSTAAALAEALREVRRWKFPDGPCWCIHPPLKHHTPECVAAREALARWDRKGES